MPDGRPEIASEFIEICRNHGCLLVAASNLPHFTAEDPIDDAGVDQHDRKNDDARPRT